MLAFVTDPVPRLHAGFASAPSESREARDERLFRAICTGDARALEEAFHAHYDELYRFAYRYVRAKETAEELTQDAFLKVWEKRDTLHMSASGPRRLRPLLFRVLHTSAIDWLRHRRVDRRF